MQGKKIAEVRQNPQTQDKEVPSDAEKKNLQKQSEEKPVDAG